MPKVYTKTGDKGETGRFDGSRVPKNDPQIEVNGAIDECNSLIGLARCYIKDEQIDSVLENVQSRLIVAGSEVTNANRDARLPYITEGDITAMESLIDHAEEKLPTLTNFILPAGGKAAAHLHVARTVARKVERRLIDLRNQQEINPTLLAYFNRLADTLFVLARLANHYDGLNDNIWTNPQKQ